jgi:transcriptional regulator with XRE-family HTH domain
MSSRYTSKESNEWLRTTMLKLSIKSLDELSSITKIDRGSLSRYFNQERRPSIDAIDPICAALEITSDDVTECLGGIDDIKEHDLEKNYQSKVDPRLNASQSLEIIIRMSQKLNQYAFGYSLLFYTFCPNPLWLHIQPLWFQSD